MPPAAGPSGALKKKTTNMTQLNKITADERTHIIAPKGTPLCIQEFGCVGVTYNRTGIGLSKDTPIAYDSPADFVQTSEGYISVQDVLKGVKVLKTVPNRKLIALIIVVAIAIIGFIIYKRKHK